MGSRSNLASVTPSDVLIFFGATGCLACKMILPALQALFKAGELRMPIIGVAHGGMTFDQLRERARQSLQEDGGLGMRALDQLAGRLQYVDGDYDDPDTCA